MKSPNHLQKPAVLLAMGIAMGFGAANFFASGNDEGKATMPPSQGVAKAPEPHSPSLALNTPKKLAANLGPDITLADEAIAADTFSEDISLSETVNANEDDADVTEPSPEELAKNQPSDTTPATPRLGLQETEELESRLREESESENTAPEPSGEDEALLNHEKP